MEKVITMSREERDARKALNIPLGADVTFVDMDSNPDKHERKTAGWTDDQVRNKEMSEIDQMIASAQKVVDSLQQTIQEQQGRIADLRLIRNRKLELGN